MDQILLLLTFDTGLKIIFGSVIGLCLGLTGVGGGVLIIPILQVVFDMPTVMAVGTASIISTIVKVNAGFSHVVAGNVDWKSLKWMLLGAAPATFFTTEAIVHIYKNPSFSVYVNYVIEAVIVGVMLVALVSVYQKYRNYSTAVNERSLSKRIAFSAGATCGSIMGTTGVGGGVMLLPAFNTLLGVDIKKSVGSSLVMALILSCVTAINYSKSGQSDALTAVLMSAGAFIGVPVAMKLLKKTDDKSIYVLTFAIISISLAMILFM